MSTSIQSGDLFNVKGLIAFVTGGATGIGLLIAQALEANGAIVYIFGRRQQSLDQAVKTSKNGNIHAIQGDVTNKADLERAAKQIQSAHGYINIVFANAGIGGPSLAGLKPEASIEELQKHLWNWGTEDFTHTFAVNATGAFNTVAAFLQLLDQGNKQGNVSQKSQVVVTSSIGAFNRRPGLGYSYSASKAAVTHIFKQLATTLVPYDIRANIIAPGFYPSELTIKTLEEREKTGWSKSEVPAERAGDAQDIAGAVLYLASRAGSYVNGNVLVTDGGRLGVFPATY
ncbi:unnamed protein product [Clonostachys rosea f. rosea IK726]|uniref:Uncharacterized protein n=2 Tax=Bionectria ochroleuca TaxID=29856 RepID=A0A0B7KA73_BIOOC|nr:unnamed protein product [Clonostachys rosea f. rosea IK726]